MLLPQKGYPADVDLTPESLRNLVYPIDWDGLLDYVGRPAILKPYSGGGWKHVYKVNNREELLAAYELTAPYPMTLQQFIDFDQYVRCFTFGKTDITPVAYDPRERRYLVEHEYLTPSLGARVVRDAQTINLALGYEMNTIEFAIEDDVPYAIDFLNPAPDFERERITDFYFRHVVEKMAQLVIDRALNGQPSQSWPRWEEMLGIGPAERLHRRARAVERLMDAGRGLDGAAQAGARADAGVLRVAGRGDARAEAHLRRSRALFGAAAVLPDRRRRGPHPRRVRNDCRDRRARRGGGDGRPRGCCARSA